MEPLVVIAQSVIGQQEASSHDEDSLVAYQVRNQSGQVFSNCRLET